MKVVNQHLLMIQHNTVTLIIQPQVVTNNTTSNNTTSIVTTITAGDIDGNGQDDVIIDYGSGNGIWVRMNNDTEVKLIDVFPEIITTGDIDGNGQDEVIIDGGDLYGIWIFMNNSTWLKLHRFIARDHYNRRYGW